MKKIVIALIATVILASIAVPGRILFADGESESIAPGKITFVGKNKVATANGIFHKWKFTTARFDPENLDESLIEIEVDIASIDTKWARRDNHLREEEFFYIDAFPTAMLKIDKFAEAGKNEKGMSVYRATLVFTLRGIQKTYDDFMFSITDERPIHVTGTFQVLRTDFKVGNPYNGINPLSIKDEISIAFDVTLPL